MVGLASRSIGLWNRLYTQEPPIQKPSSSNRISKGRARFISRPTIWISIAGSVSMGIGSS